MKTLFLLMLLVSPSVFAHNYPCTFTYSKYPDLCVEVQRSAVFMQPASEDLAYGKLYVYFWKKGSTELKNISNEYDVSVDVAMPSMMESSICVVGKLLNSKWVSNKGDIHFEGESAIMAGLYRVGVKVKKKGTQDRYSELKRLIDVPVTDSVYNKPSRPEFAVTTGFTYQFIVPLD
jgi:hypothetical protein